MPTNIISGVEKPCDVEKEKFKGLKWLIATIILGIPFLIFIILLILTGASGMKKKQPAITLGPYETVHTESITLQPGESTMLKTFVPGKSPQLDYLFEFTKASEQTIVDYSRHGKNGEYGGDQIGGAGWCRPAKANTITGDGEKNSETFYIRIKNGGDVVSFNFHLKGYRKLSPNLEK
jgi:hypothetical protein